MAEVKVLIEGYTNADAKNTNGEEKTCPTISLIKDEGIVMVVDPGVLESQQILINKLEEHGLSADDVNFVCITHSHIDHYRNIGMFPDAKTLEYFGLWEKNTSNDWQEDLTENIRILKTPGHDYTSITLLVKTENGVVAVCGDVFWKENYPLLDPYAQNQKKLEESRKLVLRLTDWIIPGHGPMYKVIKSGESGFAALNQKIWEISGIKNLNGKYGKCKRCKKPFLSLEDKCLCQEKLCFHCCECDDDCGLCNCKHKRWKHKR